MSHQLRVQWGLNKGDRAILAFNFGLRFFVVFLGCLRAGVVAVPVYPPSPAALKKSLRKMQLIVDSCQPTIMLIDPDVNKLRMASKINVLSSASNAWPDLPYKCPDVREESGRSSALSAWAERLGGNAGMGKGPSFDEPSLRAEDVAFLQFTSGSTSEPKGVMLTFGNVEHNVDFLIHAVDGVSI